MGLSRGPMACLGAAWLARAAAGAAKCAEGDSCSAGGPAGALMMQRTHVENSMHLSDGDFRVMEHSFLETISDAAGSRRNLAAMEERAQTMAEAAVARASLDNATLDAGNSSTSTTPRVGNNDSSQVGIINSILDLLNRTVYQGMIADHVEDQKEVNRSHSYMGECFTTLSETNRTVIQPEKSELKTKAEADATCVTQKDTLQGTLSTVCADAHRHFQDNLVDTGCALGADQTAEVLKAHLDCIKLFVDRIPVAEAEYWRCNNATAKFNNKSSECSGKKDSNHAGYCSVKAVAQMACNTYTSCYARKKREYLATSSSVQTVEAGRKQEAVALARIRCYLGVILKPAWQLKGSAGQNLLNACAASTATTEEAQLTLVYPAVPNATACDLPGATPGSGPPAAAALEERARDEEGGGEK
eukprot:CAMPEP_0204512722 /NCGR_PEP_ID=MMETSP0661-20131031/1100_1 /ASSEMBLY_ACC=CAM_ASM_000606 /TAXON_ID=109239 /ORGANISM="Alexandrium margalefi, Strain AMGDE01CS-322" /LENGTH=415 /DNA_ID=CAMNT_0051517851 /DNA_START=109 /DNA_END=1354 /DNA_ORIENTATION=+